MPNGKNNKNTFIIDMKSRNAWQYSWHREHSQIFLTEIQITFHQKNLQNIPGNIYDVIDKAVWEKLRARRNRCPE